MTRTVVHIVALAALSVLVLVIGTMAAPAGFADRPTPAAADGEGTDVFINEVMFAPAAGGHEWVELKNGGGSPVGIAGCQLTDEDGNWYRIPTALPDVPAGAFVVVVFDGQGSAADDLDFADNAAILHGPPGLTGIFEDAADQAALVRGQANTIYLPLVLAGGIQTQGVPGSAGAPDAAGAPAVISFVAWGADPGEDAAGAIQAGVWSQGRFKSVARGLGDDSGTPTPNESLGRLPGSQTATLEDWTLYLTSQTTQGGENAWPVISWHYPPPGAAIGDSTFAVSWAPVEGATGYQFQMDDDSDFSSPSVDETLPDAAYVPSNPVAAGVYSWRVKVLFAGGESPWSEGVAIKSLALPAAATAGFGPSDEGQVTLGIHLQLQHKDTKMLCLDGDAPSGGQAWDSPHTSRGVHDKAYCVRASIAMMASYYGGYLSQDRVSYEIFKGSVPEGELGHGLGVSSPLYSTQETDALAWALGVDSSGISFLMGRPSFEQIKHWIDAKRPIMARIPGHMRVIDGYWEYDDGLGVRQLIHLLDPWDRDQWIDLFTDPIEHLWVGPATPAGAPHVRWDEDVDNDGILDTVDDSDGDGLVDFDERVRFHTDPSKPDSDGDAITDKRDVKEYVFDENGVPLYGPPDVDGDGLRKERDPDNDNGGCLDGWEDGNRNGVHDPGETSNFDPDDDSKCPGPPVTGDTVPVAAGSFQMGCDWTQTYCGYSDDPQHAVYLDDYRIDQTEVTNAQYAACVKVGACTPPSYFGSRMRPTYYGNPTYADYPVLYMTWAQAAAYCRWTGKRLPTEAEWEKAARGAIDHWPYPWGAAAATCDLANFVDYPGTGQFCVGDTTAVNGHPAGVSPDGALDMAGNAYEWVNDWFDPDYYAASPESNPQGPATGTQKILRGGGWDGTRSQIAVWRRNNVAPTYMSDDAGIRCAADP